MKNQSDNAEMMDDLLDLIEIRGRYIQKAILKEHFNRRITNGTCLVDPKDSPVSLNNWFYKNRCQVINGFNTGDIDTDKVNEYNTFCTSVDRFITQLKTLRLRPAGYLLNVHVNGIPYRLIPNYECGNSTLERIFFNVTSTDMSPSKACRNRNLTTLLGLTHGLFVPIYIGE